MKPNAILVNTSRGAIVDLTNLAVALDNKLIAGAALDVFEEELLPAAHPLWQMENVRRFASGEELLNIVNKEMWC